jgi:hypothetical protein
MIMVAEIDDIVVDGGIVVTEDGRKLGSVEQVFLSEDTGMPAFVTVRTGLFGLSESFVPLEGATIDGSRIRVAFDRERIKNGPRIESDRGSITSDEEKELYAYYGMPNGVVDSADGQAGTPASEAAAPIDATAIESAPVFTTQTARVACESVTSTQSTSVVTPATAFEYPSRPHEAGHPPPPPPPPPRPVHPPLPHPAPHLTRHVVPGRRPPPPSPPPPPVAGDK